jgi:hypothetical protein
VSHASKRSKDEQRDEIMTAVADGFARGLHEMLPVMLGELEKALAAFGEKLAADLVKAQAKAVRTAASTARVNVR